MVEYIDELCTNVDHVAWEMVKATQERDAALIYLENLKEAVEVVVAELVQEKEGRRKMATEMEALSTTWEVDQQLTLEIHSKLYSVLDDLKSAQEKAAMNFIEVAT